MITQEKSEEIESTTINGWLSEVCGNIPELGFSFEYENLSITVIEADELMAHEVEVKVIPPVDEEEAEDEEKEEKEESKEEEPVESK